MLNPSAASRGLLRFDPSRTGLFRAKWERDFTLRFQILKRRILELIVKQDALGLAYKPPLRTFTENVHQPTWNLDWRFLTTPQKLSEFKGWLKQQVSILLLAKSAFSQDEDSWLSDYIEQAYTKGMSRAFDEVRKPYLREKLDFYQGTKGEFLRSAFGRPVSVEKVKLLASRSFDDLKGITEQMSIQISRELVDGMIRGDSPRKVAALINDRVDKIGRSRSLAVAQTETLRAHNEGALDAFEELGVEEISVMVEWSTADDHKVCPLCAALDGIVLKVSEAHGMFPRHVRCRCIPIPANVGEDTQGQKRGKQRIYAAIAKSLKAERPKKSPEGAKKLSAWPGATQKIDKVRPKSLV